MFGVFRFRIGVWVGVRVHVRMHVRMYVSHMYKNTCTLTHACVCLCVLGMILFEMLECWMGVV